MTLEHQKRGGVAIGPLSALDAWEALVIRDLRLWCQGPQGQAEVWNSYAINLPAGTAVAQMRALEDLIQTISTHAHRPLVRHDVTYAWLGADEAVFPHIVRAASVGAIQDVAMLAALVLSPAHAERVAFLAAQVATSIQIISAAQDAYPEHDRPHNVVRLH